MATLTEMITAAATGYRGTRRSLVWVVRYKVDGKTIAVCRSLREARNYQPYPDPGRYAELIEICRMDPNTGHSYVIGDRWRGK